MSSHRHANEALLISTVLNSGDAFTAKAHGIIPEHFKGYREEYQWLLDYYSQYQTCPTPKQLVTKFRDFPYEEGESNTAYYASEVKMAYASRDLLKRSQEAIDEITRGNVIEAYSKMEGLSLEIVSARPDDAFRDPSFLDDYYDEEETRIGVPWKTLQKLTNGIGPGELWYLAARQGNGKSSYLVDMAVQAAFDGHRVCFYSMEMNKRQVQIRAQAAMAHRLGIPVNAQQMLHRTYDPTAYKELLTQITDVMDSVGGSLHIHVPSMGRVSPGVVASLAGEYDLHLIDYIGLCWTDDGRPVIRDWRDIAEVSNSFKQIALAKNTAVMAASQINREGDNAGPHPPKLKNLAQSDHLGNDGDVVLTMKRYGMGAGIFSVEKNRHGPSLNRFFTNYDPNNGDFSEITPDRADDIKDATDARDY